MNKDKTSAKSIERLSLYHRVLVERGPDWGASVFSHQLAHACQLTAAQVRRDLMAVGYQGNPNKGYNVRALTAAIAEFIHSPAAQAVAIVGMGRLGRAVATFLQGRTRKLELVAAFDTAASKIGRNFGGIPCFSVKRMAEVVGARHIEVGILAVPAGQAQAAATQLAAAGVTGILSFAPAVLRLPMHVYVQSIDMSVALERVAFFARSSAIRNASARPSRPRRPWAVENGDAVAAAC